MKKNLVTIAANGRERLNRFLTRYHDFFTQFALSAKSKSRSTRLLQAHQRLKLG